MNPSRPATAAVRFSAADRLALVDAKRPTNSQDDAREALVASWSLRMGAPGSSGDYSVVRFDAAAATLATHGGSGVHRVWHA